MLICPLCGKPMDPVAISGVEIDFCRHGCKGLWFDNFELTKLDETHEGAGPILEEILASKPTDDSRDHKLKCPRCDIPLRRRQYRAGSDIAIDSCYSCNGIFLDPGELALIRENFKDIAKRSEDYLAAFDATLKAHATPATDPFERTLSLIPRLFSKKRR